MSRCELMVAPSAFSSTGSVDLLWQNRPCSYSAWSFKMETYKLSQLPSHTPNPHHSINCLFSCRAISQLTSAHSANPPVAPTPRPSYVTSTSTCTLSPRKYFQFQRTSLPHPPLKAPTGSILLIDILHCLKLKSKLLTRYTLTLYHLPLTSLIILQAQHLHFYP